MDRVLQLTSDEEGFGCAEATLVALQEHFDLPDASDGSAAMALNGGIAYSGGTCGAITGAVLALGKVAGRRITDHADAKVVTRRLVQHLMAEFAQEFGAVRCRQLTGFDLAADHDGFLESGVWESGCMAQMRFVLDRIGPLHDEGLWRDAVDRLGEDEIALPPDER